MKYEFDDVLMMYCFLCLDVFLKGQFPAFS